MFPVKQAKRFLQSKNVSLNSQKSKFQRFYSLARQGILRFANAPLRMTASHYFFRICRIVKFAKKRIPCRHSEGGVSRPKNPLKFDGAESKTSEVLGVSRCFFKTSEVLFAKQKFSLNLRKVNFKDFTRSKGGIFWSLNVDFGFF